MHPALPAKHQYSQETTGNRQLCGKTETGDVVVQMRKKVILLLSVSGIWAMTGLAQTAKDSTRVARSLTIDEVVVTGTRNETDVRHLPMTISVVNRKVLEQSFQPSVLPVLTEQVPGLFTTSRGIMGYGVSTGAAGGMSLRGIGGSPTAGVVRAVTDLRIGLYAVFLHLTGHDIDDASHCIGAVQH